MIFETGQRRRPCFHFNHCAICARPFPPGAIKYINHWRQDQHFNWYCFYPTPSVCEDCLTDDERSLLARGTWKNAGRCTVCDYPMRTPNGRGRLVCSSACANRRFRDRHRVKATACAECGLVFQPARKDAAYCSNACRQHAYRRRLTADRSSAGCLSETPSP